MKNCILGLIFILIELCLSCYGETWAIKYNESENICLLATFSARLYFGQKGGIFIPGENPHNSSGICEQNGDYGYAKLELSWDGNHGQLSTFGINFALSDKHTILSVENIYAVLKEDNILDGKSNLTFNKELDQFTVKDKYSYKCKSGVTLKHNESVSLEMSHIQWEVFRDTSLRNVKQKEFLNTPEKCPKDVELSKSVPIIAGIVMACLVVVVIGFLIFGRMRYRKIPNKY